MHTKEDWLMRPVLRGLCQYESLLNGALNIVDIAKLNEALDVYEYNSGLFKESV